MKRSTSRRDPIFAAIARHRAAAAAWAKITDPDSDPKGDAKAFKEDSDALEALLCTSVSPASTGTMMPLGTLFRT